MRKDLNQALAAFERAIAIDPNLAVAHNYVGQIKVFLGRANEAAEHTLKAIQLSPRDPQLAKWYYQLALTYIHQQRYDEAVEWARRGVQVNPDLRYPYRVLAAALALSGRVDEARVVAAEMLRRYPKETIGAFLTREPWPDPIYLGSESRDCRNAACRRPGMTVPSGRYSGPDLHRLDCTSFAWRTYSITSSARARSIGEISRPMVLAVLRLMTISILVGNSTGRLPTLSPLRILST